MVEKKLQRPQQYNLLITPVVQLLLYTMQRPDMCLTGLNISLNGHQYLFPARDSLFPKLNGGFRFAKIELPDAFLQVKAGDQRFPTINTDKGLFRFNCLSIGVRPAIDAMLTGLTGFAAFFNGIIVVGAIPEDFFCIAYFIFSTEFNNTDSVLKLKRIRFSETNIDDLFFLKIGDGPDVLQKGKVLISSNLLLAHSNPP